MFYVSPAELEEYGIGPKVTVPVQNTNSPAELVQKEPTEDEIVTYMIETSKDFYNAREDLRERAYGGKPPEGFPDWGTYWQAR